METKRLTVCDNPVEAENLMIKLHDNNIEFATHDESTNKAVVSGALPGIEIFVKAEDLSRGRAIVAQMKEERDNFMPWCPECGCEDVTRETVFHKHGPTAEIIVAAVLLAVTVWTFIQFGGIYFILPLIITGVIAFDWQRSRTLQHYTCKKCGHKFKRD